MLIIFIEAQVKDRMNTKIVDIFTKHLPSIPSTTAEAFAQGMQSFYDARQDGMEYEIMVVGDDELWVHTPHFRKILGQTISELFNTKITMFRAPCTQRFSHSMVFVDAHNDRWSVSVLKSETQYRICMRWHIDA
jgi:hypothetical protein